ncbi:MAG: DUF6272 family protein [Bacteroidota bacterium]
MDIKTTKSIYDKMVSHQFVVSIMGMFDQELLLSLINITDKKLSGLEVQSSIKRKIFHFMVECSQNLLKVEKTNPHSHNNIFLIGQEGEDYTVYLGSAISKKNLAPVLETIEQVNTIEATDIKKKYYNELTSNEFVDQNFLLLSLLSISKKTRKKIDYDLIELDPQTSFLSFKMTMAN